ncbi:MAG TPA: hypothetical protein VJR04_16285 [Terriglobales bacterium]|nr:hypothetical protein [Terriglobales bacterium]
MQPRSSYEPNWDQEVRVRYVDAQGAFREERLHLLNLATFILNNIQRKPVMDSEEMHDSY